jgi:hypothetical protein
MALVPGGVRPRFGGAPGGVSLPNSLANGNGSGAVATPAPINGNGNGAAPPVPDANAGTVAPREDKPDGGVASFLIAEMTMPDDMEDADFDDEMLRLSHKIHSLLVDELGGQQFNSNDRERLRPVAQQVMNDVSQRRKTAHAQTSARFCLKKC